MKYGLWDTEQKNWLGNGAVSNGPSTYDNMKQAEMAAIVAGKMLGLPTGTIEAVLFREREGLSLVGLEEAPISAEEAINQLEDYPWTQ